MISRERKRGSLVEREREEGEPAKAKDKREGANQKQEKRGGTGAAASSSSLCSDTFSLFFASNLVPELVHKLDCRCHNF